MINWTDQGGGAEFVSTRPSRAQARTADGGRRQRPLHDLALSKSNLMDYDVKAPASATFIPSIWDSTALGAGDHHTALPVLRPLHHHLQQGGVQARRTR